MSQGPHVDKNADEAFREQSDTMADIMEAIQQAITAAAPEAFPVGSVYVAEDGDDVEAPADALGYGTWVALTDETIGEDEAARTFKRWVRVPDEEAAEEEES